ncbi:S8 family peptidase [Longimicrobium sp.]|uniref:S8 family peptidase n=1 Tax=Longimicrobium sp. TaxID=2029185 RepID=UPI002E30CFDB|nr:S8 family serine peptidase [Longimicrobium sp.]
MMRKHVKAACLSKISERSPVASDAIVFKVGDPSAVREAVEGYTRNDSVVSGLRAAIRLSEIYRDAGAELIPIYPERALGVMGSEQFGWKIALPDWSSQRSALSAYHFLQLPSSDEFARENAQVEMELLRDPLIRLLYHPALPYVVEPSEEDEEEISHHSNTFDDPQWFLRECKFPLAWQTLDQSGTSPGPIGMIDMGGNVGHPDLGNITVFPFETIPSTLSHASGVAGVIAARRNGIGIDGCCSAEIHLHNVAPEGVIDRKGVIMALKAVKCKGLRVVNISLEMAEDHCVRDQIKECIDQGMIIVAAMGNRGEKSPYYPAAYPGVIAVGAVNKSEKRLSLSNTGSHIWLSAPGFRIHTIEDAGTTNDKHNGTSYAAAMVSAAAWLTLRARPYWTATQVRDLLSRAVHRSGKYDTEIGYGRLDMGKLIEELKCTEPIPCPDTLRQLETPISTPTGSIVV